MRKEFENIDPKEDSSTREALSVISLAVFVILILALLTRDALLGDFGLLISNVTLGIFGFSAYAMLSFAIITSVVMLFTKKSKNNGMIIVSLCLMLFAALIALQVWTANASMIVENNVPFAEFVKKSYDLEASGIFGSSAGGIIMSAIIYYPVKVFNIIGTYVVASVLFMTGVFGAILGMKKKFSSEIMRQVTSKTNSQSSKDTSDFIKGKDAVKVGFGTSIGELRTGKADSNESFQKGSFFNRNVPEQEVVVEEKKPSAQEILYGRAPVEPEVEKEVEIDEFENEPAYSEIKAPKKNARLFISNVGKTTSLNQKTKREIQNEVKKSKKAKDILFSNEEESSFTINNANRPRNLSEDRNHFDQRMDTIRETEQSNSLFSNTFGEQNQRGTNFEDAGVISEENYKRPFITVDDNINVTEKRNEENSVSRKALFDNTPTNVEVTPNQQPKENLHYSDNIIDNGNDNKIVAVETPAEDPILDMFRITIPKVPPKILTSKDVKKKKVEVVEEVVEEVVPEKFNILEPRTTITSAYIEERKKTTTEFKDLLASGKLQERILEIPEVNYSFEKKMPKDAASIKILTTVEQLHDEESPEHDGKKYSSADDNLTQAIKHAPIDDAFNEIQLGDLSNPELVETSKQYSVGSFFKEEHLTSMVSEVNEEKFDASPVSNEEIDLIQKELNSTKTRSVFYPLNQVKEIKTTTGEVASQLPIIAKETYSVPASVKSPKVPYAFPPMDLLDVGKEKANTINEEIEEKAIALEAILKSFSINAKVVETVVGPSVTRYELEIQQGTQVKRIEQISKDITMGLESPSEVIILAPIPGKNRVGIEVPNRIKDIVYIKSVIDTDTFKNAESKIAFALGKQVDGTNVMCDIAKMPHMLIAGSTGTGKSVALNTILISLLYSATPDDVRIILIDPKRVEFTAYRGLPHLLIDEIIYDSDKAISAMNWAIDEMEKRFMLFQAVIARDLDSYNAKLLPHEKKLPRIVIIMDELADLMSMNKKELEEKIMRIAQKSRAAGIHLVLATQRPSVNVITGVIKTNLPSRISFKLSNGMDSKTVLDEVGAEKLLGYGDMFFKPVTSPEKIRLQGCFVSSKEVEKVVNYVVTHNKAEYDEKIKDSIVYTKKEKDNSQSSGDGESQLDEKFVEALRLAIESSQISISMIQRRYNVGFNRAGKILDTMEKMGYVSSFNGSKPREVFITREQFEKDFGEY